MMTDYQNKLLSILPQEGVEINVKQAKDVRRQLLNLKKEIVNVKKENVASLKLIYVEIKKFKDYINQNVKKRVRKPKVNSN